MADDGHTPRRFGKRELGRYAFEDQMPARVAKLIEPGPNSSPSSARNQTSNVIPCLAALLENERDLSVAYLCRPSVVQISRLRGEGSDFCGYRNIQMILSSYPDEAGRIRSIPELQQTIEDAWSKGINAHARLETGGIVGTRKHIGTSECETLLTSFNLPSTGQVFKGRSAAQDLLDAVQGYFSTNLDNDLEPGRVRVTTRAPLFLQRPSHSLTIVGVERCVRGKPRLLVFDPGYMSFAPLEASSALKKDSVIRTRWTLSRYRRDLSYFKRFHGFELLSLDD